MTTRIACGCQLRSGPTSTHSTLGAIVDVRKVVAVDFLELLFSDAKGIHDEQLGSLK